MGSAAATITLKRARERRDQGVNAIQREVSDIHHMAKDFMISIAGTSTSARTAHLPVRKVLRQLRRWSKYKSGWLSLCVFLSYTTYNLYRFDANYASSSLSVYEDAESKFPGISKSASAYCQQLPDGTYQDTHTNDTCVIDYNSVIQVSDLNNFIHANLLSLPTAIKQVCD